MSNNDRLDRFEFDDLFEPHSDLLEFEFDELLELAFDGLLELEFDELLEFEFDELLELEFEELLELEFEELFELEFDELLPANCSNFSSEVEPVRDNPGAGIVGEPMMLLMPPVSTVDGVTAACEAPVAPVIAANAKASMEPVL